MNSAAAEVKSANRAKAERDRAARAPVQSGLPRQIQVEPTNRCNLECPSCARNYYDPALNRVGDFDPDRYPHFATLLRHADGVLLGGYGEPLMGKHTRRILELARNNECVIEIITNATFLDDAWAEAMGALGVDRVLFSTDGADDTTMRATRGVDLDAVLSAVARLHRHAPKTTAVFNVTLSRRNRDQIPALVEIASDHGVADVIVTHQKIYTRAQEGISALADPAESLEAVFARARIVAERRGVGLTLPPTSGEHDCAQPLELMMVRHDGACFACCSAMFGGGRHRIELGYLDRQEPSALWNAPAALAARRRYWGLPHDPVPCDTCAFRVFTAEAMIRYLD
jgi:MoaA/NifB/PqqE/SkfB family radical SAM enzyme